MDCPYTNCNVTFERKDELVCHILKEMQQSVLDNQKGREYLNIYLKDNLEVDNENILELIKLLTRSTEGKFVEMEIVPHIQNQPLD